MKNTTKEAALHPLLEVSMDDQSHAEVTTSPAADSTGAASPADHRQMFGIIAILLGIGALLLAWWGVTGTADTTDQLSYIGSGVSVGGCLLVLGTVLIVAHEHARDREALQGIVTRLGVLEQGLAGEFDHLDRLLREPRSM
jgi:hypothetical protein